MKRLISSLFLGAFLLVSATVCANAYVLKPCESCFCLEGYTFETASEWTTGGDKVPANNKYEKWGIILYGAYGLTCRDTLVLEIGYADVEDSSGDDSGVDEIILGWKRKLWQCRDHVVSWQSSIVIPGGDTSEGPGWRYGKWGSRSELLYSTCFDTFCCRKGFFDFSVGYLHYYGFPGDQILSDTRLALDVFEGFQLIGGLKLEYGLMNGTPQSYEPLLFNNADYRLLKGTLGIRYSYCDCLCFTAGWREHLWGEHVGAGGGPYASLCLRF